MIITVTGGAGFIGSHVVEYLNQVQPQAQVRVLDNLRTGHRRNLAGLRCEFIEGSILDRPLVEKAVAGAECVYHLAALVSVPESMLRPRECVDINVTGTLHVLEAAAGAGCRKLVFASSAAIYGDDPAVPKVETMLPAPRSPYAVTKLDGEYYLDLFAREGRIKTASLRFFNVFGPRQDPGSAYAAAVPIFIDRALRGQPLTIYGDGEQTRDFIYVKDIAAALHFCAAGDAGGTYNVGYGRRLTINELAREVLRLTGSAAPIEHQAERPGDVRHSLAAAGKLRAAGWAPRCTLEQGLAATVDHFSAQRRG